MRALRFSIIGLVPFAAAAALLAAVACEEEDVNLSEPPAFTTGYSRYFPLAAGNSWQYRCTYEEYHRDPVTWNMSIEVTEVKKNYRFAAKAYVLRIREDGKSDREVIAACAGDACFLDFGRPGDLFRFLLKDSMEEDDANETGFFTYYEHYRGDDEDLDVPAGTFPHCMSLEWGASYNYEYFEYDYEYYAKDVGLACYKEGNWSQGHYETYDSHVWTYELVSYTVAPPPE